MLWLRFPVQVLLKLIVCVCLVIHHFDWAQFTTFCISKPNLLLFKLYLKLLKSGSILLICFQFGIATNFAYSHHLPLLDSCNFLLRSVIILLELLSKRFLRWSFCWVWRIHVSKGNQTLLVSIQSLEWFHFSWKILNFNISLKEWINLRTVRHLF